MLRNALSEQVFSKWIQFQISLSFWELQVTRDCLGVRDIAETSLNRLLLLLILKSSHRVCSIEKGALKNFTGKHFCWNLFLRLHETHNALKLPGSFFSFFFSWVCQGYPEYQEILRRNYFIEYWTANTIPGFRDLLPAVKIHDCY